jgi:hypothetical protein
MRGRSAAVVLTGLAAGAAAFARRRRRDSVELHYDDGSMVILEAGTPAGDRLLELARASASAAQPS